MNEMSTNLNKKNEHSKIDPVKAAIQEIDTKLKEVGREKSLLKEKIDAMSHRDFCLDTNQEHASLMGVEEGLRIAKRMLIKQQSEYLMKNN